MNGRCKQIQDILAEFGATAFQDDGSARRHLADCADCYAVLTALSELEAALPALPIHDASDECVETLLARVRDLPRPKSEESRRAERLDQRLLAAARRASEWHTRFVASAAAVAVVSAACVTAIVLMVDLESGVPELAGRLEPQPALMPLRKDDGAYRSLNEAEVDTKKRKMPQERELAFAQKRERVAVESMPAAQLRALGYIDDDGLPVSNFDELRSLGYSIDTHESDSVEGRFPAFGDAAAPAGRIEPGTPEIPKLEMEEILVAGEKPSSLQDAPTSSTSFSAEDLEALRIGEIADIAGYTPNLEIDTAFEAGKDARAEPARSPKSKQVLAKESKKAEPQRAGAERDEVEDEFADFAFQEASGYWTNAYVPGDPAIRLLESRLNATDREMLQASSSAPLLLHDRARQVQQPFDAPTEAAMQVFLHGDRSAIEGVERFTLQVGLQGARRQGGTRPPMNIGIVLDLRGGISAETATQMRAVVDALRTAREVGDQFSLSIAGRDCSGVKSDRFEYGPLSVAMEACFGADAAPGLGQQIAAALESATHSVRASDDPDAPLGSSMVLLVTSQSLADDLDALEAIGHESAVAGVPISVAGIGSEVELEEIDRLTLAGQGSRRLVTTSDEAREAVDRELAALSRAVARALRLRIRLAPGVKLIGILDASRLDDEGAERVREAEQSIDLRLASELGIEADRGEDEDGIQIVIPSFYAGDSHAILLDVVAREAGPIADVTLRYKDLIYQRNGVARANIKLGSELRTAGPLERNVLKNVLAIRMSSALKSAGRALEAGRVDEAARVLGEQRVRLVQRRAFEPAFQSDAELKADLDMLDEYLSLLGSEAVGLGGPRRYLANSLQLSGHFKTLPRTRAD